jgi:hypothetical protein
MKSFKILLLISAASLSLSTLYLSCTKSDFPYPGSHDNGSAGHGFAENSMVLYWNYRAATVLGVPMRQPDRSRYFAIIEIAVHDALNNIKPKFEPYLLNEPTKAASPDAAVASAAYRAIKGLNLQAGFPVDSWYDSCLALIPGGAAKEAGKILGQHAAEAIIANRAGDGFSQVIPTSAQPANGTTPGAYRQTNAVPFRVIPNWGIVVKPYVVQNNSQFRPAGPYDVKSAEYAADYREVAEKGAREGSTRSPEDTRLAKFWADNKPSLVWNDFANKVIADKKMDAWKTARTFALLHTAIADGFNTVLESKYHFYYWRPETAIHEGDNDGNAATTANATWLPFVIESIQPTPPGNWVSPPLPEYPSGYTMTGGVVAEILMRITGSDKISVAVTSNTLPGETLHYHSLAKAARDNSLAKVYAGWYFRKGALDGEEMGKKIAHYVFAHSFREK